MCRSSLSPYGDTVWRDFKTFEKPPHDVILLDEMRLTDLAVPAHIGRRAKFVLVVVGILLMRLSLPPKESGPAI